MKSKHSNKQLKTIQHPLFGISLRKWIKLVKINGYIDTNYLDRALFITFGSLFLTVGRSIFKFVYEPKIMNFAMEKDPVFIIGHWRSGTTFLHELLSQDPQFCFVSLWNTLLPESFPLFDPLKNLFSHFLPRTRPMDNIEVDIDAPYEEEAGLAALSLWSFFHALHFPKNAEEQYLKSVHFLGLSSSEKDQWKLIYKNFLKTISYSNNGKQLLLKNPANTGRISVLLELFPNAKFIYIYRNPYNVYLSTVKMRNKVLEKFALQQGHSHIIEQQVIDNYIRLMKSYFNQKQVIPSKNRVEIKYEDLVKEPLKQIKHIYSSLQLEHVSLAIPRMETYLLQKKNYKTNVYTIDEPIIKRIEDNWKFTIDRWGYNPPK